jgi:hypothetical protein
LARCFDPQLMLRILTYKYELPLQSCHYFTFHVANISICQCQKFHAGIGSNSQFIFLLSLLTSVPFKMVPCQESGSLVYITQNLRHNLPKSHINISVNADTADLHETT